MILSHCCKSYRGNFDESFNDEDERYEKSEDLLCEACEENNKAAPFKHDGQHCDDGDPEPHPYAKRDEL